MLVAIDFDGTFARDPSLFRSIVALIRAHHHDAVLVTGRSDEGPWGDEVRAAVDGLMPIVFAGGAWKREAAMAAGFKPDIWFDDWPEYIAEQDLGLVLGKLGRSAKTEDAPIVVVWRKARTLAHAAASAERVAFEYWTGSGWSLDPDMAEGMCPDAASGLIWHMASRARGTVYERVDGLPEHLYGTKPDTRGGDRWRQETLQAALAWLNERGDSAAAANVVDGYRLAAGSMTLRERRGIAVALLEGDHRG